MLADCWPAQRSEQALCCVSFGQHMRSDGYVSKQTGCSSLEWSRVGEPTLCRSYMTYRPDGFRSAMKGKGEGKENHERDRDAPCARPP